MNLEFNGWANGFYNGNENGYVNWKWIWKTIWLKWWIRLTISEQTLNYNGIQNNDFYNEKRV